MGYPKRIVALVGPLGAGKDTIAKYLVDNHSFKRLAFADEIKHSYYAISGYSEEQFKSVRGTLLEVEIRTGLWKHSDQVKKEKGSNFFINKVVDSISDCRQSIVVTDVRTPEELITMRSVGAEIILVLKIEKDNKSLESRCSLIPGSKLLYKDVEQPNDKLFLNYKCEDLVWTNWVIEMFCRHIGILEEEGQKEAIKMS